MTRVSRGRLSATAATLLAALLFIVSAATGATAGVDATSGGGSGGSIPSAASVSNNDGRPSVALIVDVSEGGREALPEHSYLWQGVVHALAAGGRERVTVLLVAGENVRDKWAHTRSAHLPQLRIAVQ